MNNWKKVLTLMLVPGLLSASAYAQEKKKEKLEKKSEQIIIKKKGDTDEKMTIVIDGDKVTINGKPVDEFKGEDITILRGGGPMAIAPRMRAFAMPRGGVNMLREFSPAMGNKALLGVVTEKTDGGAKVAEVSKESAAEKAGLKEGDVITKVGDSKVESHDDLVAAIGKLKPKDKVDITYLRDGKQSKTTATLGEQKARAYAFNFNDKDFNFEMPEMPGVPEAPFAQGFSWNKKPKIGLQIQDMEAGSGVTVKDVDEESPALKAGLKEGDVITQVNGKDVKNVDELKAEIKDVKEGDTVKFSFKRNGKMQSAEVKLPKKLKTADL